VDENPVAAWQVHCDGVQAVLDDPETVHRELANPHIGRLPLETAIDQFYTADVFMHTWDLSRATGQDDRLDPDFCAQLLGGMEQMEQVMRSSGQYGPRVEVPGGADTQTRLLGFIGRDLLPPGAGCHHARTDSPVTGGSDSAGTIRARWRRHSSSRGENRRRTKPKMVRATMAATTRAMMASMVIGLL
jgi:hypothetical protein